MDKVKQIAQSFLESSDCTKIAVAKIDFNNSKFDFIEVGEENVFDLASLTKPLINSFNYIKHDVDDEELYLLLCHRAGLPAWGRLSRSKWKEELLRLPIKKSFTLYSDYSALRYMLEFNEKIAPSAKILEELPGVTHWINSDKYIVHDPNAFNLKVFTSHAGLFSNIENLCNSLISFNQKYDFIQKVSKRMETETERFVLGFDRVEDLQGSTAGEGCSDKTFGHLGFTGTSFWIDSKSGIGTVILTDIVKEYWFNRSGLNDFRKEVGKLFWA